MHPSHIDTSEPPTPIGIDIFFFLHWLSGQQVVDTGRVDLPTHWIFIRPQITETPGMCAFISAAKPPATSITQQPRHSAVHSPFLLLVASPVVFSNLVSLYSSFSFNALSVLFSGFYSSTCFSPFLSVLHESLAFG